MHKNKIIFLVLGFVLFLFGGFYLTKVRGVEQHPTETTKVRIADLPVIHGLPVYVAMAKGYFKDVGLDVELLKYESPNQIVDAVMTGQVDITSPSGALGIAGIANSKNPGKLKVYAISGGTKGNSGVSFVVPTHSTLDRFSSLKGKKLGIIAGSIQWQTLAKDMLMQNGLDSAKDVDIVELAPSVQIQALATGKIDALLAIEPIPTIAVTKSVAKVWIPDPTTQYISDPSWLGAGMVNVEFARENPNTTSKMMAVLARTIDEINKNPDEYRQYLKNNTPLADDAIIKAIPLVSVKVCGQIADVDKNSMEKFFDIFTKKKIIDGSVVIDDLLYCK